MKSPSASHAKLPAATWTGLALALFGIVAVRWLLAPFWPPFSLEATLVREPVIWLCVVALFFIIRRGEGLTLRSVNLGTSPVKKSILWGGILVFLCGAVGAVVSALTHFRGGEMGASLLRLPVWLAALVALRAGVAEELFYRGYAIERLEKLGLNRWLAALIPLVIFGVAHIYNGWQNVVLALALGAVLAGVYLWRRDLLANMIGHFLIDLISVVLPRFLIHH